MLTIYGIIKHREAKLFILHISDQGWGSLCFTAANVIVAKILLLGDWQIGGGAGILKAISDVASW